MQGPATDRGVNYRALGELFDRANEDTSRSYKFRVSMLEVSHACITVHTALVYTPKHGGCDVLLAATCAVTPALYMLQYIVLHMCSAMHTLV
jgi:hypothetical protein